MLLIQRETTFSSSHPLYECEKVMRFEVMDGNVEKGEEIPIRVYLRHLPLTPTYTTVGPVFEVCIHFFVVVMGVLFILYYFSLYILSLSIYNM